MTREKVLAMEPGPEMDAAIAEKVFGKELVTVKPFEMIRDHGDHIERVLFAKSFAEKGPILREVPPYSTVDAAALEVLKAFSEWWITRGDNDPEEAEFEAEVRVGEAVTGPTAKAHAQTLALAICRAALLSRLEA